jgi:hypothetical protein
LTTGFFVTVWQQRFFVTVVFLAMDLRTIGF